MRSWPPGKWQGQDFSRKRTPKKNRLRTERRLRAGPVTRKGVNLAFIVTGTFHKSGLTILTPPRGVICAPSRAPQLPSESAAIVMGSTYSARHDARKRTGGASGRNAADSAVD